MMVFLSTIIVITDVFYPGLQSHCKNGHSSCSIALCFCFMNMARAPELLIFMNVASYLELLFFMAPASFFFTH